MFDDPRILVASLGSRRRPSPTAHEDRHVMLDLARRQAPTAATSCSSRLASSMVTEMLTSDVLTTSIAVRQRSKTSNTRRRTHAPSACTCGRDVDDRDVALAGERGERLVDWRAPGDERAAAVELAAVQDLDRNILRHRRKDGARVHAFAPSPARSLLERQSRHHVRRFHDAGSAVIMPSTSVQIWISLASSAAPRIAAE